MASRWWPCRLLSAAADARRNSMTPGADADPLAELRDLHLPPDPGWWPLAPGWWLVGLLTTLAVVGLVWLIRHWRRPTPRRVALQELKALQAQQQTGEFPDRLAAWWRRCAIARDGQQVAALTGERWHRQLQQAGPGVDITPVYRVLFEQRYQARRAIDCDRETLLAISKRWAREALK